jgi:hypothetical protein
MPHTRARLLGCSLSAAAVVAAALAGCEHDVVLPDQVIVSTCGNGVTEANEECDVASPGCVNCQVQPEWTCTATGCSALCTDGVVSTGSGCVDPHRDTACDMTGFWAVRETAYFRDNAVGDIQASSQWYMRQISQTGDTFSVVSELDCGVHVTGPIDTVDYPEPTLRGLIWLNPEDGTDPIRGQRHGTSVAAAGGCAITFDRWYFVRGVTTAFLPTSFASQEPLSSLPPLPTIGDPITSNVFPPGATDPTTLGIPGEGTVLSGLAFGLRYAAQRTSTVYATTASVPASAMTVVIPGTFDLNENVLRTLECGDACAALLIGASPATNAYLAPFATFQFIGKTLGSARVAPIVGAAPRNDVSLDLQTCANVRQMVPHDGTVPSPPDGSASP